MSTKPKPIKPIKTLASIEVYKQFGEYYSPEQEFAEFICEDFPELLSRIEVTNPETGEVNVLNEEVVDNTIEFIKVREKEAQQAFREYSNNVPEAVDQYALTLHRGLTFSRFKFVLNIVKKLHGIEDEDFNIHTHGIGYVIMETYIVRNLLRDSFKAIFDKHGATYDASDSNIDLEALEADILDWFKTTDWIKIHWLDLKKYKGEKTKILPNFDEEDTNEAKN